MHFKRQVNNKLLLDSKKRHKKSQFDCFIDVDILKFVKNNIIKFDLCVLCSVLVYYKMK